MGLSGSAYNYLGSPYDKKFNMLQAHVESDAIGAQVQIGATVDFDRTLPPLDSPNHRTGGHGVGRRGMGHVPMGERSGPVEGLDRYRRKRSRHQRPPGELHPGRSAVLVFHERPLRPGYGSPAELIWMTSDYPESEVISFVAKRIGTTPAALLPAVGAAILRDGVLVAGVVYNNYHVLRSGSWCEISAAADQPRCLNKEVLRVMFDYPFLQLGVGRLQAVCAVTNWRSRRLVSRLGFQLEGVQRRAHDGIQDSLMYSMLPAECIWI